MTRSQLRQTSISGPSVGGAIAACISALLLAVLSLPAHGQSFQVLHSFTDGLDGSEPWATVIVDQRGNLYGTTLYGGANNLGTVFKLTHQGAGWVFNPLYSFTSSDGVFPEAPLTIGPDGTLFGTTIYGGAGDAGTVYNVRPPSNPCRTTICLWNETVLHSFTGSPDGGQPGYGPLVFDQAGNGYGTTISGGINNGGVVYRLSRSQGAWTESVVYTLTVPVTGIEPYSGLVFDRAGNLYATASTAGGLGTGTVYELTNSEMGWAGQTLYAFPVRDPGAGAAPYGGVVRDAAGNLYGTTTSGGANGQGTIYELTYSGGSWSENVLFNFSGVDIGPKNSLAMDASGNLYGTNFQGGGYQHGNVFRLSFSNGQWVYTDLHDFTGGEDGELPEGGVAIDANGNLYGTTSSGGTINGNCTLGCGVVWEITP